MSTLTNEPSLFDYAEARDAAMAQVEENSGEIFQRDATDFILRSLQHGEASGEDLTDSCKRAGIQPHDDRAFGPVFMRLVRAGAIEKCGYTIRKKGHGTGGGNIWRVKQ